MNEMANEVLLSSTQAFPGDLPWQKQLIIPWRGHKEKRILTNLSMKLSSTDVCYNQVLEYFTADTTVQFIKYQIASHNEFREDNGKHQAQLSPSELKSTLTRVCTVCVLHAGLQ